MGTGYIIRRGLATCESAPEETGEFSVKFFDYDGTLLKEKRVDSGGSVTAPDAPDHTDIGLTFQEWHRSSANVTADIDIGATYTTTDGKTWVGLKMTTVTTLDTTLYYNKSDDSTLSIDWGDGGAVETDTASGNSNKSHTYSTAGSYIVKMWISVGSGTYGFGHGSNTTTFVGGSAQIDRDALQWVFIGDNVTGINSYAFRECRSLTDITIPSSVTSIGTYAFQNCYSLTSIIIPNGVTSIGDYAFDSCYSLTSITIPNSVTSIGSYAIQNCLSVKNITIPSSVTIIGTYMFQGCSSLTNITIPSSVIIISDYMFQGCYSLTNITIPSSVTSISSNAFFYCNALKTYIFERTAGVTTLSNTNAFININSSTKIYVPDALVNDYKSATNWSTYANYIYPISEKGVTHND